VETPHLVWQAPGWPALTYDRSQVASQLSAARHARGMLEARWAMLNPTERQELASEAWTQEALATSAIEGEQLDLMAVRSSVLRRLGVRTTAGPAAPRSVDGLLDVMDDAVTHADSPLTADRLQGWQAALFPTGFSGRHRIRVGAWRDAPMQIVSGPAGRETVHYEAPRADRVPAEMDVFLRWFESETEPDQLLKAAVGHLWFETIHPFDDGNGRIGRALVDLVLAREAGESSRLVCISQRLQQHRGAYYDELEHAQHGGLDVTRWLLWFLAQVRAAWEEAAAVVDAALEKGRFWGAHAESDVNPRQRKAVNVLLEAGPHGFEGGLSTRKYASLTHASKPTAYRDLAELSARGLLKQVGAGRSTRYYVNKEGWYPAP
jgi:Fic family protein